MAFVNVAIRDWHFRYQCRREVDRCLEGFQTFFDNLETREMLASMPKKELSWWFIHHLFGNLLGYEIDVCGVPKDKGIAYLYQEKRGKRKTPLVEGVIFNKQEAKGIILLQSPNNKYFDKTALRALWASCHYERCSYAIVSNFRFLRFYIRALDTCEEFDLFNLTFPRFKVLYMLLQAENFFQDLPASLHHESRPYFKPPALDILAQDEK